MAFSAQITADISNFERNLAKAGGDIEEFSSKVANQLDKVGDSFTKAGKKASILSAGLVAVGTKSYLMAADIEDAMGATDQVFKQSSEIAKTWASNLGSEYGIAKKQALEYQNLMGTMLKNIGNLTEQEAGKQARTLVELAGDLAAMYGGTTSEAISALNASLRGINVPITKYGVGINDALVKTKAFEMGIANATGEMSINAKQAATLALIFEQTSDAQGQAAREAETASGSMRALRAEITNLTTELGDVLLPIITPIITRIKEFVSGIRDLSPEAKKMIVVVAGLAAAIGPLLLGLGGIIKTLPLITAGFTAITGPIGIAVAAIAGIAILVVKNWDKISAYFTTGEGAQVFNEIQKLARNLYEFLKQTFTMIKNVVVKLWDGMGSTIVRILKRTLDVVMSVITAIIKVINDLIALFTADSLKGALIAFKNLFVNSFNGIWDIVKKTLALMTEQIGAFFRFIGATKIADKMQNWAKKLSPELEQVIEHTVTLTKEQKENNEAMTEGAEAVDGLIESLNALEETKIIPKGSLNALTEELKGLYDELNNATTQSARLKIAELIKVVEIQIARISASVDRRKSEIGRDVGPQLQKIDSSGITDEDIWNVDDATLIDKAKATFEAVREQMGVFGENVNTFSLEIAGKIGSTMESLAIGLANSLAGAISAGDNIIGVLASTLLNGLGNLAIEIGVITLGIGEAITAIFTSLINPLGTIGAGLALIALGVGLKAVAGAIGSKRGSNVSQGGYTSGPAAKIADPAANFPRGEFQLAGSYSEEVEFRISGDSLVGILSKKENKANRLN